LQKEKGMKCARLDTAGGPACINIDHIGSIVPSGDGVTIIMLDGNVRLTFANWTMDELPSRLSAAHEL